jgi:hypothetical protein
VLDPSGLLPNTCVIVIDNILWARVMREYEWGEDDNAQSFDLVQFGCDGDRRVLLATQRIDAADGAKGVARPFLDDLERDLNLLLQQRAHCTCR